MLSSKHTVRLKIDLLKQKYRGNIKYLTSRWPHFWLCQMLRTTESCSTQLLHSGSEICLQIYSSIFSDLLLIGSSCVWDVGWGKVEKRKRTYIVLSQFLCVSKPSILLFLFSVILALLPAALVQSLINSTQTPVPVRIRTWLGLWQW